MSIPEEYSTPVHSAIVKYAKEQRKKHGYKEEIQCQPGVITPRFIEMFTILSQQAERGWQELVITPRFIEMFTMLGDEQQMVDEILKILSSKGEKK